MQKIRIFGFTPKYLGNQRLQLRGMEQSNFTSDAPAHRLERTSQANLSAGLPLIMTVSINPNISFMRPDTRTIPYMLCGPNVTNQKNIISTAG